VGGRWGGCAKGLRPWAQCCCKVAPTQRVWTNGEGPPWRLASDRPPPSTSWRQCRAGRGHGTAAWARGLCLGSGNWQGADGLAVPGGAARRGPGLRCLLAVLLTRGASGLARQAPRQDCVPSCQWPEAVVPLRGPDAVLLAALPCGSCAIVIRRRVRSGAVMCARCAAAACLARHGRRRA